MAADRIPIPEDLLQLKPSDTLESIPLSKLARSGTALLRQLTEQAQAVRVKVQGQGAMVTVSQRQYDEMVALIGQLQEGEADDGFRQALSRRFDDLVAKMNQPGAAEASEAALFGESAALNRSYRPGATESGD